jgi:hypothetical protein
MVAEAGDNQCEVVLVGCGAPKRGMGWYHAVQMMKGKCPSAKLCFIVEPWFMGAGTFDYEFSCNMLLVLSIAGFCLELNINTISTAAVDYGGRLVSMNAIRISSSRLFFTQSSVRDSLIFSLFTL